MQFDWKNMAYWPKKTQCLCLLGVFLSILLFGVYGYAWPRYQAFKQCESSVKTIPKLKQGIRVKKQSLMILKQKSDHFQRGAFFALFNQKWQAIDILTFLRQLSAQVPVILQSIEAKETVIKKIVTLSVALSIQATYQQWVAWLASLSSSPFAWRVSELQIQPFKKDRADGLLQVMVHLTFFHLLKAKSVYQAQDRGLVAVKNMPSPFLIRGSSEGSGRNIFVLWGVFSMGKQVAVVKTPLNRVLLLHSQDLLCTDWQVDKMSASVVILRNEITRQQKMWLVGKQWHCPLNHRKGVK